MSIIDAIRSARLFAPWFKDRASWAAWFAFLRALFGLAMSKADMATFRQCTGRDVVRPGGYTEAALVVGRRGGKSLILALVAVFLAVFLDWRPYLSPGERGVVMIVAADKRQARVIYRYARAFLTDVPALSLLIERETAEVIDLKNGITIEILAANFRTLRGYSVVAFLGDESAFWNTAETGSNPDTEILSAVRPAQATIPGAVLLLASSPYAKRGALYQMHRRYFGRDEAPALIWRAPTRTMNPSVPQRVVDEAYERDPASAAAEFGAEFRSDVAGFLDREIIDASIDASVLVRPRLDGVSYRAHIDVSGGLHDSFTAGIAHKEVDVVVLDALYERRAPFNPSAVTAEVSALLASYRVTEFEADRYSARWAIEAFAKEGRTFRHAERDRSAIYLDALPLWTSGRARLLGGPIGLRCAAQLAALERKVSPAGRDRVEPGPIHDDLAVVCAGALLAASAQPAPMAFPNLDFDSTPRDPLLFTPRPFSGPDGMTSPNTLRGDYWSPGSDY